MTSIVTIFEDSSRALASAASPDPDVSRFLVGTQSVREENSIHLLEYRDDINNLAKISFRFPHGEIWHLAASASHPNLMAAVTGQHNRFKVSLFRLPAELEKPVEDDYGMSDSPIELVHDFLIDCTDLTRHCHWHPDNREYIMTCNKNTLQYWNIETKRTTQSFSLEAALARRNHQEGDQYPLVNDFRWSSLFDSSVVGCAIGNCIYGIDGRLPPTDPSSTCWIIQDDRCNYIRSLDFNPNSQYHIASGGDDCRANFWDVRNTSEPVLSFQAHSHWIWSIRYNPFHDQLVLSAGSDARVALMRAQSIASEPFGQVGDLEDEEEGDLDGDEDELRRKMGDHLNDEDLTKQEDGESKSCDNERHEVEVNSTISKPSKKDRGDDKKRPDDGVINIYEEHDDAVYAAEWATDPWIFASLGYESRLVINKVPKSEKFNILF